MGEPNLCRKGHDRNIVGINNSGQCKQCRSEYQTGWRNKNPEKNRAYDRKYYWENPEKARAESAAYREKHKDDPKKPRTPERIAYSKQYHIDNAEREKEYRSGRKHIQDEYNHNYYKENKTDLLKQQSDYYHRNKEWIAAKNKEWRKKNPEIVKKRAKANKSNRRSALGKLTVQIVSDVWDISDGQCAYCLTTIPIDGDWHLEHCTPISRGGTNFEDNLVVSCIKCNNPKYRDTVLEHLMNWPKVTERYDFFIENKLSGNDIVKLNKLHLKYGTGPSYKIYNDRRPSKKI